MLGYKKSLFFKNSVFLTLKYLIKGVLSFGLKPFYKKILLYYSNYKISIRLINQP